jgi:hypothetical protein
MGSICENIYHTKRNGGYSMGTLGTKFTTAFTILILVLMGVGMESVFLPTPCSGADEIGANEVQGKVIEIRTNIFRKGTIVLESDQTGKTYTIYVGRRTVYVPHRYPAKEETIKVHYIVDRGFLKATRVEIIEGS